MSDEWNVQIFVPAEPGVPFPVVHEYRDRGIPQAGAPGARGRAERVVDASVESLRENCARPSRNGWRSEMVSTTAHPGGASRRSKWALL